MEIKYKTARRRGFSLTEMLVVVLIMGVLVGVVGSLMGGFVTNFEMTDDQSIARRRAQDVFNILQTPILNAGLGIPPDNFDYYFAPIGSGTGVGGAPMQTWHNGPIEVISHDSFSSPRFHASENRGDALRIVYSVYSGVKNLSSGDIVDFGVEAGTGDVGGVEIPLSGNAPVGGGDGIQFAAAGTNSVRSYVTFPGISMHPEMATGYYGSGTDHTRLSVSGKQPHVASDDDVLSRNVIRAYHDMFLVKAGLAYVDDNGTFCLYEVNGDSLDPATGPGSPLPYAASADIAGANERLVYRVEGIKAIRFVRETDTAGRVTGINVYVLAEGDNAVTGRTSDSPAVKAVRERVFPPGSPRAGQRIWPDGT
ncbi:MAG: type II secretion system GspH family protein, partial [Synergistaceae bacterium]|nr:type II secretion system GspH family protein [Synergistaceae bacterium]